jgi:hypothetical protein
MWGVPNSKNLRGGLRSFGIIKKTTSYGIGKMYLLYIFPPELQTRLRCSNFFNPSKKNYFGCAANRKCEKPRTYQYSYVR